MLKLYPSLASNTDKFEKRTSFLNTLISDISYFVVTCAGKLTKKLSTALRTSPGILTKKYHPAPARISPSSSVPIPINFLVYIALATAYPPLFWLNLPNQETSTLNFSMPGPISKWQHLSLSKEGQVSQFAQRRIWCETQPHTGQARAPVLAAKMLKDWRATRDSNP